MTEGHAPVAEYGVESLPAARDLPDEIYRVVVQPWYLPMMSYGAVSNGRRLAAPIARLSVAVDDELVVRLLRLSWRERVMGAWLSLTTPSERVVEEVLRQVETSWGLFDAPALAAAAIVLAGSDAMIPIAECHRRCAESGSDADEVMCQAADALAARLGVASPLPPSADGADGFVHLLRVADSIRSYRNKYQQHLEDSPPMSIDDVWNRVSAHAGDTFRQVRGKPFSYSIHGSYISLSSTNQNLSKASFEAALERVPLAGPSEVQDLRGPSYIYAILMDARIRASEW